LTIDWCLYTRFAIYEMRYSIVRLAKQNSYPLKDWHFEHMQKTVVKFISGLSELESGSSWKKRQHKKYSGNIGYVRRSVQFDIKHGVSSEEVVTFLDRVRNDISFSDVRKNVGSGQRLEQLENEKGITTLV
jgi:nicotinic acid mononucleotide adenylyltransferase